MNDELIEVYWLSVVLIEMLIEMDDIRAVSALSDTISYIGKQLAAEGIDPDNYEIDITITHATYIDDDAPDTSAFNDFVNSLDLGE